jgi:hypothetical protein
MTENNKIKIKRIKIKKMISIIKIMKNENKIIIMKFVGPLTAKSLKEIKSIIK